MSYLTSDGIVSATTNSIKKFTKGRTNFKEVLFKMSSEQNRPCDLNSSYELTDEDILAIAEDSQEKTAAGVFETAFKKGLGATTAGLLIGAGMAGAGMIMNGIKNKILETKYEASLQSAIRMSPALSRYDINTLRSYMPMIINASPTVARDPRLLANYLESMLDAEGHLNLGTFRELSSLENTVLQNKTLRNPASTAFVNGIAKGIGTSIGDFGHGIAQKVL